MLQFIRMKRAAGIHRLQENGNGREEFRNMRKKWFICALAVGILGLAAGCGSKEESSSKDTETEEFVLANKAGYVVAVDVDNLEDYITLGNYKNLAVEEEAKKEVTDEETEENIRLQMVRNYAPVEVTEGRAVAADDTVNIDYTGYMDGETFDGGSAQGYDLIIGSGSFISGFEDGLIGHKKGEEVTLDLTFPQDYKAEEMQGKAVQFKVKINKISEPAELTDEWVTANTEYKTVEEYKAAQKEALQKAADSEYEGQVKSDLFEKVLNDEKTDIKDYPEDLLKENKALVRKQLDAMYQSQAGITLDQYLEQQNIADEEADEQIESIAKSTMDQNLLVQAILNAEKITLSEEEYREEEESYAKLCGFESAEAMESMYSDQQTLKEGVLWNVACNVLMETAKIEEKAQTETE